MLRDLGKTQCAWLQLWCLVFSSPDPRTLAQNKQPLLLQSNLTSLFSWLVPEQMGIFVLIYTAWSIWCASLICRSFDMESHLAKSSSGGDDGWCGATKAKRSTVTTYCNIYFHISATHHIICSASLHSPNTSKVWKNPTCSIKWWMGMGNGWVTRPPEQPYYGQFQTPQY